MGENSKIEWTHHTLNPWIGCEKISPGCKNCYAEARSHRFPDQGRWGPTAERKRTSWANWRKPYAWNRAAKKAGERHRVFCASLADVFDDHASIAPEWRDHLWKMIEETDNLDWLLLTKRPENILTLWPWGVKPPANVWLGTTAENDEYAQKRIPYILRIDATVRFVSYEPALGPVEWRKWMTPWIDARGIDWLIVGGESGHGARPFSLEWARAGIEAGEKYGVPVFVKQLGAKPFRWFSADQLIQLRNKKGGDMAEWPEWARVRQIPGGSE